MLQGSRGKWGRKGRIIFAIFILGPGCEHHQMLSPVDSEIPRELSKVTLPAYVIEPPDILLLDAVKVVPQPPYKIEPLDVLLIQVSGIPEGLPQIDGNATVDADGTVNLGQYGVVSVLGRTLAEAQAAIEDHLKKSKGFKEAKAVVLLVQSRAMQQIRGEHLVRPDGIISLGTYGSVYVTGMTVPEAKAAIEEHLSRFLLKPEIRFEVLAYNSKVFYIITDGGGYGQQVVRLPITGNETVLDAMSQINGLPAQASKKHIWIARPSPSHKYGEGDDQILPVDWNAITELGRTATNYQLLPGDRIYVKADSLITLDNTLAKILSPLERIFGVSLLGNSAVRALGGKSNNNTGTGF